jgi:hypothetical protein
VPVFNLFEFTLFKLTLFELALFKFNLFENLRLLFLTGCLHEVH